MIKYFTVLSLLTLNALANNAWYVVDKAPQGDVPFYLKPNSKPAEIAQTQEVKQENTTGEESQSVAKTATASETLFSPVVPEKKPSILVVKSKKQFRQELATEQRLSLLPTYSQSEELEKENQQISSFAKDLETNAGLQVISAEVLPDAKLKKNKYGVARATIKTKMTADKVTKKNPIPDVDRIEVLNIGTPKQLSSKSFTVPGLTNLKEDYEKLKALKSPAKIPNSEINKWKKLKVAKVNDHGDFDLKELVKADALVKKIEEAGYAITQNTVINEKAMHKLFDEEMNFMQAELLYSKGDQCHAAAGIYYVLLSAKNPHYRSVAKLKLGVCSHKMGLFTESVKRLLSVLKEKEEYAKREALKALLSDLPLEHQLEIGEALTSFRDYHLLEEKDKPAFNYVIAKYYADVDQFAEAQKYANQVDKGSKYFTRAQYIVSVSEYLLGKKEQAFQRQNEIEAYVKENGDKEEVMSLVAISKARMNFQRRKYKDSIAEFLKIDRNHPMWIEGLQQQAWAQMMVKDEPGAVGNMHSIHTPFFKHVYKPESFVIRGLGYINLCQYADAYRSVKNLEFRYKKDLEVLKKINKENSKKVFNYYKMAANYLANPKKQTKLSGKVLREAVRQRKFLNQQDAINKTYDENEQYSFLISIIDKDIRGFKRLKRNAKKRKTEIQAQLDSIKTNKKLRKNKVLWEQQKNVEDFLIRYYGFRIANYKYAKMGMKKFSKNSQKTLRDRRNGIKMEASQQLAKSFRKMEKNLSRMLQNNELLKYEIFSGAGENLRYRISGGKTVGRTVATTSQLKEEGFNWEFDGEFWEDEVGHYRSSLKNACPKSQRR